MRCATSCAGSKDRCVLTSVLMLGSLFALSTSPCGRVPLVSALVIIGVPLMTFAVAAPSRIGLARELGLFWRGAEALLLEVVLLAVGRRRDAFAARDTYRARVEMAYAQGGDRLADAVADDPLRLHHARRLASFATLLALFGGVGLPFVYPDVYTFGEFPQAPFVFAFDVLTFGLVGRLVGERVLVRLFEASHALHDGIPSRLRATPLTIMLGAALGAVGALVVVSAGALACAVETSWFESVAFHEPAFWFIRKTAPQALSLGITAGAVLGAGMGLAKRFLPPSREG